MLVKKRCATHGHVDHDTYHGCMWCKEMAEERAAQEPGQEPDTQEPPGPSKLKDNTRLIAGEIGSVTIGRRRERTTYRLADGTLVTF